MGQGMAMAESRKRETKKDRPRNSGDGKLGTFLGVYTPTILTILGVIMYLRIGWLVGHMGLGSAILIVLLANSITLITALSFSSIATNIRVGVGGAYYIISRSLGLEIGGAIGLPLFLSQALSVTLYSFGLAESLRIVWPEIPLQFTAFVIVLLVGWLSFKGAKVALKTQIPLLMLVGISLVALAWGAMSRAPAGGIPPVPPSGEVFFWVAFAIFFPAVTGVMAGLGLSGDLRDPSRAIPLGAIAATLTGFGIYLLVPVLLVLGAGSEELRGDTLVWTKIAPLGPLLILPGLWGAIFSSAVGSMLGAPRTFQALLQDNLPGRSRGMAPEQTRGLATGFIISIVISLSAIFLGGLNKVAVVVTMFFLTVYGAVNVVAALETLSADPSWRPKFLVPWPINLAGGIGCMVAMFLISPTASIIAIIVELALWLALSRRERTAGWGDVRHGAYEALIRWALIRLARRPMSARNWRPHVLVFVDDPERHVSLVRFAEWFSQARGVVTVCKLAVGDLLAGDVDVIGVQKEIQESLDREGIIAFADVNVVSDVVNGITGVAQASGFAGMESNTILLGWPKEKQQMVEFLRIMRRLERLKKSMIIGRISQSFRNIREDTSRTIHIWWGGLYQNGDLMLLLAYLLARNPFWRGARVKVISIASNEFMKTQTEQYLQKLFPEIRIEAESEVIERPKDVNLREVIQQESAEADVIFFGLATPGRGEEESYAQRMDELSEGLGTVFFVKNSSLFVGELLTPDSMSDKKLPKV